MAVATRATGGRRRKVVIGGVALVAAGVAVAVGTTGTDRTVAPPVTSTAIAASVDTTLVPAPQAPTVIGDGRPLLGERTGLSVLLADYDGNLHHLDLDTGALRSTRFTRPPGQESRLWFLTEDGLVSTNASALVLRQLDGTERTLVAQPTDGFTTFANASRGQIWAVTQTGSGDQTLRRIDLAAASVVESVSIGNAQLVGADETGRPLLQLADTTLWQYGAEQRWTMVGPLTTRPLGHGLYLNSNCSTPPACSLEVRGADQHVVYTVATSAQGQPVAIQGGASNGTLTALVRIVDASTVGSAANSLPPDVAIDVYRPDGTRVATFADVLTRYDQNGFGGLTWSADGTWLFWLGLVKIHAWRVGLAQPIDIDLLRLPVPAQHMTVIDPR